MSCSQGALARLYVEPGSSPHTFDSNSETYEFLSENLIKKGVIVHPNGIRGTRSQSSERARLGPYTVGGSLLMNIDPASLDNWLPRILGATASGTTFAVAEGLPAFGVLVDRVTRTFELEDCYIGRAVFQGRSNQYGGEPSPLIMNLDIVGKDRNLDTAAPSVSLSTAANSSPYIFEDLVLTVGGTARQVLDFMLVIDNHLQVRFTNSLSATDICPQGRTVFLSITVPFASSTPLTSLLEMATAGLATSLVATNGNMSLTFNFATWQCAVIDPHVPGKQEIVYKIAGYARMTGTTREIIAINDSTS